MALSLCGLFFVPAGAQVSGAKNQELKRLQKLGHSGLGICFFLYYHWGQGSVY